MKYELSKIKVKSKEYYDNLFGGIALKGVVQNAYIDDYNTGASVGCSTRGIVV